MITGTQQIITEFRDSINATRTVEVCELCNGTGLTPSIFADMKVAVCSGCNGHGKVIVHEWVQSNLGEVQRRVSYTAN